jgi:hypothetical protein
LLRSGQQRTPEGNWPHDVNGGVPSLLLPQRRPAQEPAHLGELLSRYQSTRPDVEFEQIGCVPALAHLQGADDAQHLVVETSVAAMSLFDPEATGALRP